MEQTIESITKFLNGAIPQSLSEPWDNDGLMVDSGETVKKAVCALDATSNALEYAKKAGAQLVLTHHPLIFDKLSSVRSDDSAGKRVIYAIKNGISVMSFHTRLDALTGGVNDMLISVLGLEQKGDFAGGLGRVASLPYEMSPSEFTAYIKEKLRTEKVCAYTCKDIIKTVAVLGGSGKSFIKDAALSGADAYLTGEVNHSGLIDAKESSISLFTATHYVTEAVVLPKLKEIFNTGFPDIPCEIFYEYENF